MSRLFYAGVKVYRRMSYAPEGKLVFSIDNGTSRFFVCFNSFEEFEPWYRELSPGMRTLSEVIQSDVRKLILDIDSPNDVMLERLLMYDFQRHVTSRIHDVFFLLDIGIPKVLFYSMCSDDKISYHAVVSNFMFSAQTCLGLCAIISSGQVWESCVDRGVYKKIQFVRIEKSTKFKECRWKKRLTDSRVQDLPIVQAPHRTQELEQGSLREGLLSDPVGTQVSDFATLVRRSQCVMLGSTCGSASLSKYINGQFRIGKPGNNSIVPLYRTKPGFCIRCNRTHDRENAFIKYYAGKPVFICWRHYYTYRDWTQNSRPQLYHCTEP